MWNHVIIKESGCLSPTGNIFKAERGLSQKYLWFRSWLIGELTAEGAIKYGFRGGEI